MSWRAAFLVNLPIGLAVLWLTPLRVPESRAAAPPPVDDPGGALATVGLGGLTVALVYLPEQGAGSAVVLAGAAAAAIGLPAFLYREHTASAPMMPLGLFADRMFSIANALTLRLYGALSGAMFLLPNTLIGLHAYSAAAAGSALLPLALAIGLLSRAFGGLGDRIGAKIPMRTGRAGSPTPAGSA